MPIDRRALLGAAAGLPLAGAAAGARAARRAGETLWPPRETVALWPGAAPGAPAKLPTPVIERNGYQGQEQWLRGVAEPVVGVFRPSRADGRAVLVIPGGGYGFVSVSNEGIDVAGRLNAQGITAFVLAYRLPGDGWADRADVPLQDAQRAMRVIRHGARRWGIDPARLGVLGFSAGGHLAAMLAVGHADPVYSPRDADDRQSARPAFAGLVYAVTDFTSAGLNSKSSAMLLGDPQDSATLARHTPARRVTRDTPPLFFAHACDDPIVPLAQSLVMLDAARRNDVAVEGHFFATGGHGFGALHLPEGASGLLWPELFARWSAGL